MFDNIKKELIELKGIPITVIIDEGRSRKRTETGVIKQLFDRIFLIEINNMITSFSYSDIISKTIILKKI